MQSPGFLLWHVSTAWRSSIEGALKPLGLTHPQFVVLASIGWLTKERARVSQAAVGQMAGLDPNTASQVIRGLEQKNFIRREPFFDVRVKNPFLTTKGKKTLHQALPAVEKADAQFFSRLHATELRCLIEIFQKLTFQSLINIDCL